MHARLTPEAVRAWQDAANKAGSSVSALVEAVGRKRALRLGAEAGLSELARSIDMERSRRPGPRAKKTRTTT